MLPVLLVRIVLDGCVRTGKEQTLMTVVAPANEIGRAPVGAVDLEDLGVAVGLADVVALDDETISDADVHDWLLTVRTGS
jgi:hypothetical protein